MSKKEEKPKLSSLVVDSTITGAEAQSKDEQPNMLTMILGELKKFESARETIGTEAKENKEGQIKIAFDVDPERISQSGYGGLGLYRQKVEGLPDALLKRITSTGGDDLVCQIVQARSNHISLHGRPRETRFDIGYDAVPKDKTKLPQDPKTMEALMLRVEAVKEFLATCGKTVIGESEAPSFSQFLKMAARDGLVYGRFAVAMIDHEDTGKFHAFRAADSGTIYRTNKFREQTESYRKTAMQILEKLYKETGKKVDVEKYLKGDYTHVQVINGKPIQMFTADEMLVHNLYPVTNVEYAGYPLTPIDQAIHAVTTHINITLHNKLYFQHGRAARGMIIVKSRSVPEQILQTMRMQFQNNINSVRNAHRMPVFGIGPEDEINWTPIDNSSRDMEFQYLSDSNARVILGAFNMSPEELPGYQHLSRGTNTQALCLDLSSKIFVKDGYYTLAAILGEDEEVQADVWTGKSFQKARVFKSGIKDRIETSFSNSTSIITSPDHRFLAVDESGASVWKKQKELKLGDAVLINKNAVAGQDFNLDYNGVKIDEKFAEFLGWMTGDGNINLRYNKNTGNIKSGVVSLFYHHNKEVNIWEQQFELLQKYGINVSHKNRIRSQEEKEKTLRTYKWESTAPNRLTNLIYDTKFVKWLLSLGFTTSTDGKTIPAFLYTAPEKIRAAFLRGFFSADGTKSGNNEVPRIVIHDNTLRNQTKYLLLSLGIRTQNHEGKTIIHPKYLNKEPIAGKSYLCVKDKHDFFEKIGFIQSWKQPTEKVWEQPKTYQKAPEYVTRALAYKVLKEGELSLLSDRDRNNLHTTLNKNAQRTCSLAWIKRIAEQSKTVLPDWTQNYHVEEVTSVVDMEESIEMADVEIFDNEHAFVANGIIVHNSETNNEYKLTAARDVGLRPLLLDIQDFVNRNIIPRIDPEVSKYFAFVFAGIDKDSPEKESTRLTQDQQVHLTYNEIMDATEKERISKLLGGDVPMNPIYWQTVSPLIPVGVFMENYLGVKNASKDPRYSYIRDPLYFQHMQMLQMEVQQRVQMMMMGLQQQQTQQAGEGQPQQSEESSKEGTPEENLQRSETFIHTDGELAELKKKYGL